MAREALLQGPSGAARPGAAPGDRTRERQEGRKAQGEREEEGEERRQVMAIYKRGGVWWYGFVFKGERIQESTKQGNKRVAGQMEAARKTERAKGLVGIQDKPVLPILREFEKRFVDTLQVESGPKAANWYGSVLKVVLTMKL